MAHDPPEHIGKILTGIDFEVLAVSDEAHEQRRPVTSFSPDEEPVFSTDHYRTYGILHQIVVGSESPVFQIEAQQGIALIQGVIDRLPERFRGVVGAAALQFLRRSLRESGAACSCLKRRLSSGVISAQGVSTS